MRRILSFTLVAALILVGLTVPAAAADEETYIVTFRSGLSSRAAAPAALPARAQGRARTIDRVMQAAIVPLTAAEAAAVAKNPSVATVQKDRIIHKTGTQTPAPWHLDRLDGRQTPYDGSYTSANDGAGVRVYVIDSGIARNHQEFAAASVADGVDYVKDGRGTSDCDGHGTFVSSMVVGRTYGTAKAATLVPMRVLNCTGDGLTSSFIDAANAIVTMHPQGVPGVVNMSLGDLGTGLNAAAQGLIDHGFTVVVAAGNNHWDACNETPASLPAAITVTATNQSDAQSWFSNTGSCVDVYAPGENVTGASHIATTATTTMSGTSMASPLVAGAAAQVLAFHPTWAPAQVWADLRLRAVGGAVPNASPGTPNLLLNVGPLGTMAGGPVIVGSTATQSQLSIDSAWSVAPDSTGAYQWFRAGVPIPGATGPTYTTADSDLNQPITVSVTASKQGYQPRTALSPAFTPTMPATPGTFRALTPARLLDTREGIGAGGPVAGNSTVTLQVAGRGGVPVGASAVVVNLTVTQPGASGFLTAHAQGTGVPGVSNVNFTRGQTVSNLATVPLSADGRVSLEYASVANGHLVADVQGFVVGGTAEAPGAVVPVAPQRMLDTRFSGAVGAGGEVDLPATGRAGVPAAASAVILNVTVVDPMAGGFVTAYPGGTAAPGASNLNFVAGQTVANLVVVKVGPGGTVRLRNGANAPVHLVADIQAYVIAGQATASGALVPVTPTRAIDTRANVGAGGPVGPRSSFTVNVARQAGLPANVQGAVTNLTAVETTADGYLTTYPAGRPMPLVSNVNFAARQTLPNLAFAALSNGSASFYLGSGGPAHVVADVSAYVLA